MVEREWLDELPVADPRAMRSRRDLRRVNRLMTNAGIVAGELRSHLGASAARIAELGAGDGTFALRVTRALKPCRVSDLTLLDRQPAIDAATFAAFARLDCTAHAIERDVHEWLRGPEAAFDAIFANLFLHHFESGALREMLALIAARTRVFVACEPRRSSSAMAGSRLLGLLGCNDVTRHDAVVSVRAGFRGGEIAALWPGLSTWRLEECARGLFSHSFVAVRR